MNCQLVTTTFECAIILSYACMYAFSSNYNMHKMSTKSNEKSLKVYSCKTIEECAKPDQSDCLLWPGLDGSRTWNNSQTLARN